MENNGFTHEPFDWDLDSALAAEWTSHQKRHRRFCREWLPRTGFVISREDSPVMMLWIYFDMTCTMGFLDWVITRPGQSFIWVTKPAMAYAHRNPIREAMLNHGADILVIRGHRALTKHVPDGWYVNREPLVSMSYIYTEEELNV